MKRRGGIRTARRSGGFTLLELLLAFMVFALSFATVLEIISGSMRNSIRARHFTEAAMTAQSIMDQVGVTIPLEAGQRYGGEEGAYRWDLEIYEYAATDATVELAELTGIGLLQVDLYVSWGVDNSEQTRRFSTIKSLLAGRLDPEVQ